MAAFTPSEAALEGFRLTWERPAAVLLWTLARLLFSLAALALFISQGGAQAAQAMAGAGDPAALSPEAASALVGRAAPALFGFLLINVAGYAVIYAAILRSVLRPAERRAGALRISRDELLQFLLALIIIGLVFSYGVTAGVLTSIAAALPDPLGGVLKLFLFVVSTAGLLAILVRLSLAPAATFAEGRLRLFSAAPLTRGAFWPILATYGLALILTVVVALLAVVIFFLIVGAIGLAEGGVGALPGALRFIQASPSTLAELASPRSLINLVFDSLLAALAYTLMLAPGAAVFRALRGGAPIAAPTPPRPGAPWG